MRNTIKKNNLREVYHKETVQWGETEISRALRQSSWFLSVTITINGCWLPAVRTNTLSIRAHFSQIYFAAGVTDSLSLNQFTFTYLFRYTCHSQRCMQWVSHPHLLLSSPIPLPDAMANGWLQVTDTDFLFPQSSPPYIYTHKHKHTHTRNISLGWCNDNFKINVLLFSVVLSLSLWKAHTYSYTHNKCPHLPKKHLSKSGMVNLRLLD